MRLGAPTMSVPRLQTSPSSKFRKIKVVKGENGKTTRKMQLEPKNFDPDQGQRSTGEGIPVSKSGNLVKRFPDLEMARLSIFQREHTIHLNIRLTAPTKLAT